MQFICHVKNHRETSPSDLPHPKEVKHWLLDSQFSGVENWGPGARQVSASGKILPDLFKINWKSVFLHEISLF